MTEEVSKEQIKGENGTGIDEAKRLKEKKGANMVVKILAIVCRKCRHYKDCQPCCRLCNRH